MRSALLLAVLILLTACGFVWADTTSTEIEIGPYVFGAIRARAIGPATMGGRIASLAVVNADPRKIYIGAASGGIWKSANGGVTFDPVFDKYNQSIGAITIDQARPDTIWVGTGEPWVRNSVSVGDGIYRSTDGGKTWKHLGLEDSERIGKIVIDPRDPKVVYVAVIGHLWNANEDRGLYKTTDGGESWEKILYVDNNTGCGDIAIDPQEPDNVYASMWQFRRTPYSFNSGGPGSGFYRSTDAGENWERLSTGLPKGELGRIAIAVAPSRPNVVYAIVESKETALYRSTDLGETWTRRGSAGNVKSRPFYFSLLLVDPSDYNRLYKPATTMSTSSDGGETFQALPGGGGGVHPDYHALWIDPNDPTHLLLGTDGGIYVSYDRGFSWRFMNQLPVSQFYHVSCDSVTPYNVYGGLQDNGSWYGPSQSVGGIENCDWTNVGHGDGFHVYADPLDNGIIYYEYQGGNIYRYYKATGESKEIIPYPKEGEPDYRFNWNTPVALSPTDPTRLYVGAQFLFRTTDRGDSWQRLSDDLTTNDKKKQQQKNSGGLTIDNTTAENHCTIFTISESPLDPSIIWVGTDDGNLQVTQDDGKSWSHVAGKVPGLPKNTWVSCVEAGHHDKATAFVTFDGHRTGDMQSYVYKTTDLGNTWTNLATDSVKGYAHVIREDLVKPNLLFVGTEFGLFISIDGGHQWARFTEGLPQVPVKDMVINPRKSDLVLATHGRGIYIIDDIAPLRQLTPEVLTEDMFVFETPPVYTKMQEYIQEFPGNATYSGDNPEEAATIAYYLKKRHLFGDFMVEIYGPEGNLVKTLPGGKRKGVNLVTWYMRMKPPKVAPAQTLAAGALFGPMVPEGTYTYKLLKGNDTAVGKIEIAADPSSPHSAEDRALQQQTVMKLYRMQGDLGYIASAVDEVSKDAKKRADGLKKGDNLKKSLLDFSEKLDELHDSLVANDDRQGITQAVQLRERVTELYGSVSSYGGKPSETQLMRMALLEKEIAAADGKFRAITDKDLPSLNSKLEGKSLEPIKVLTRVEFDKRQ